MKLIKPNYIIISILNENDFDIPHELIEYAGRTCYKSDSKYTLESAKQFVKMIKNRGHDSVLEHSAMTVKFICDRGISHELVRHRLCAFSQESTRYVNYKNEGCIFIIPPWVDDSVLNYPNQDNMDFPSMAWVACMKEHENEYLDFLDMGWRPEQARSVLPNSLKTEIVVTTNFREWHHIFKLRTSKAAHPQMRELMIPLLKECKQRIPIIFDDIKEV